MRVPLKSAAVARRGHIRTDSRQQAAVQGKDLSGQPRLFENLATLMRSFTGRHTGAIPAQFMKAGTGDACAPVISLVFDAQDGSAGVEIKISRAANGDIVVAAPEGYNELVLLQRMADDPVLGLGLDAGTFTTVFQDVPNRGEAPFEGFTRYDSFRRAMVQASQSLQVNGAGDDADILILQRLATVHRQRVRQTYAHVVGEKPADDLPLQALIDQVEMELSRLTVLQSARPMEIDAVGFHLPGLPGVLALAPSGVLDRFDYLTNIAALLIDLPLEKADIAEIDHLLALAHEHDRLDEQVATPGIARLLELAKMVADLDDMAEADPDLLDLRATLLATLEEEQQRVDALSRISQELCEKIAGSHVLGKIVTLERVLSGHMPTDVDGETMDDPVQHGQGAADYLERVRDRLQDLEICRCQLILDMMREVENIEHLLPSSLAKMIQLVSSAKAFSASVQNLERAQQRLLQAKDWRDGLRRWDHFLSALCHGFARSDLGLQLKLGGL
jgi:hypothetical protein